MISAIVIAIVIAIVNIHRHCHRHSGLIANLTEQVLGLNADKTD